MARGISKRATLVITVVYLPRLHFLFKASEGG